MSIFSKIEKTKVNSNTFDLTHDKKLSAKFGSLVPIMVMDTVPGDSVTIKSNAMVRLAPLIAPVMHRMNVYLHYFFVPNRLVWDGWEDFITGGQDGYDTTVWPHISTTFPNTSQTQISTIWDYMGLPPYVDTISASGSRQISAIPFAAYQAIYNDYYRDQNLIPEVDYALGDGQQTTGTVNTLLQLQKRAWQHDYFTSALPWTQKGPEAMMPIAGQAPVYLDPNTAGDNQTVRDINHNIYPNAHLGSTGTNAYLDDDIADGGTGQGLILDLNGSHYADLSAATASSINDLRRAFKLQEWLEKNARGGSRYIESIAVHFGVQSSDKRLQRPEFLGGFSAPVKTSEVLQTSSTDSTSPQGNMSGHAVSFGSGKKIKYYCEEHGYIIGIMSVMPMTAYQQGIPRHFLRKDKFDYYWPEFAHIGEQAILNDELVVAGSPFQGNATFGYTPRYSEYKYIPSTVHGAFRTSLDFWHMGRKFTGQPLLNRAFIEMDYNAVDRIFAVQNNDDHLWCHILNEVYAKRKMPYFGNPKF